MKSVRPFLLAGASIAILFSAGWSASARAETLAQAVQEAITGQPSVQAAQADHDALAQEKREKWSDYMPQLSMDSTQGRVYADNSTSRGLSVTRGAGYSGLWQGDASLTETIFDGFGTSSKVHAAEARRDSSGFNVSNVQEDVALRTTLAYLDVLRSQETLGRLTEYGKKLDDYVARIGKMVKAGGADATMVQQARDIRAQLDNTQAATEGQLRTAAASYEEMTGHPPDQAMERPPVPLAMIPDKIGDAATWTMSHLPALQAAALSEQAAGYDIKAEKSTMLPSLAAVLSTSYTDQRDLIGGEAIDDRAVLRASWNLALGGAQLDRIRKAAYRQQQSRAQQQDAMRQATRRLQTAYSDRQMAEDQYKIQNDRVNINEGIFKTQKAQFQAAKVNLLQLMQSDNALFNAQLALMNSEYKLLAAQFSILADMGRLQEALSLPAASADGR